ncbi:hypothetical protein KFL_004150080 [Klebsormidium nitens]|uniref:Uncharacterized protein n=1 Tax=Klebsormidium nitens TaxID=105231 RepID=A0A1Y1IBE2_KLENI|nr:hypothetical protein KFL_004150080 [Klebsormidium nitens]|eukprot:GAQ88284.1 hypothetical protein KFL_004150080 [Klebsormidium nitens]
MFGRKAAELVREEYRADADKINTYNEDLVSQVLEETREHYSYIRNIVSRVSEEPSGFAGAAPKDGAAVAIHHESILRNKRCLLAYANTRAEKVRALRWQLGAVLPENVSEKLSAAERDCFKAYDKLLGEYMGTGPDGIGIDLTVDMLPPKDPYIECQVLRDAGAMLLDDKVVHLVPHTRHFIKRAEAEPLIAQGILSHIES